MIDFEWFTSNNLKKASLIELIIILNHKPPNYEKYIEWIHRYIKVDLNLAPFSGIISFTLQLYLIIYT